MINKAAEVQKRIDALQQKKDHDLAIIQEKIEAERKAEALAHAAIDRATETLDFEANEKAQRDLEATVWRRELLAKRRDNLYKSPPVSEEESDRVIDSLLAYEAALATEYRTALAGILISLEELSSKYAESVKEAEGVIYAWTNHIHPNYRNPSATYQDGTHRAPKPVPIRPTAYIGSESYIKVKKFLEGIK